MSTTNWSITEIEIRLGWVIFLIGNDVVAVVSDRRILAMGLVEFWSRGEKTGVVRPGSRWIFSAHVSIEALAWGSRVGVFANRAAVREGEVKPEM